MEEVAFGRVAPILFGHFLNPQSSVGISFLEFFFFPSKNHCVAIPQILSCAPSKWHRVCFASRQ
jgi:hypothetical protein